MAILKIKDKGVWKEIQAIKGDTGHDVYVGDKSKAPSEAKLIIEPVKGTATGTDIQVTDSANDRVSKLVLDGKSTQETRSGKNLLNEKIITKMETNYWESDTTKGITLSKGTYYISSNYSLSAIRVMRLSDKTQIQNRDDTKGYSFSINETTTIYLTFYNALNFPNDLKLQLEKGSATDYEPYGVMPSPDYPSEIENVKGKNLINPNLPVGSVTKNGITLINNGDGSYTVKGTSTSLVSIELTTNTIFSKSENPIKLKANTYYTHSIEILNGTMGGMITLAVDNNDNVRTYNYLNVDDTHKAITKMTKENLTVWTYNFYCDKAGITVDCTFRLQLEEGSVATRYVPYGNIQIVETGKNLADINSIKIGKNWVNGTDPRRASILNIPIEPNTKYTLSGNINSNTHLTTLRVVTFEKLGDIFHTGVFAGAFTTPSNAHYLSIEILANTTITSDMLKNVWVQLEKGPTATDYEPYTEEVVNIDLKGNELCSLPNGTKDELIVKDGRAKIIKRIVKVVLDGSDDESWSKRNDGDGISTISFNYNINNIGAINQMNNRFQKSTSSTDGIEGLAIPSQLIQIYIQIKRNRLSTLDVTGFKAWLQANPVVLQYELKEPYEIDLGEVSMLTTYEGTSNITNSENAEMSIEYVTNKTNLYYQNNGNIIKMNEGS